MLKAYIYLKIRSLDFSKGITNGNLALMQTLQLGGFVIPEPLASWYETNKSRLVGTPSKTEQEIRRCLKQDYNNAGLKYGDYIDGFEVDIQDPKRKLIIEIDGPTHSYLTARRFDERRDAYLREKGFNIQRIPIVGLNFEQILEQIQIALR